MKLYDDDAMNTKKKGKGVMGDHDLMMGGSFGMKKSKSKKKPLDIAFGSKMPDPFHDY